MSDVPTPAGHHRGAAVASRVQLPPGPWTTVLDGLCARFPTVTRAQWLDRFHRQRVQSADGSPLAADTAYRVGMDVRYFREVEDEAPIDARETLLHVDEHLVVADKPHFLPVMPAGGFVEHTLLTRLVRRLGNPDLVPLHRLDRETAGLVLFSARPDTRAAYHALFRERAIDKVYEAVAAPLPSAVFPLQRRSRLVRGEPFFRMCETDVGEANAVTEVDLIEQGARRWRYRLRPLTGRKHQLRVHMAALGAPIDNDRWYPTLRETGSAIPAETARPLQLLARTLSFVDPLDGAMRRFDSQLTLDDLGGDSHAPAPAPGK